MGSDSGIGTAADDEALLSAKALRHAHGWLTLAWLIAIPVSIVTGWLYSLTFISAISIYANVAGHFSAWQAARAEEEAE